MPTITERMKALTEGKMLSGVNSKFRREVEGSTEWQKGFAEGKKFAEPLVAVHLQNGFPENEEAEDAFHEDMSAVGEIKEQLLSSIEQLLAWVSVPEDMAWAPPTAARAGDMIRFKVRDVAKAQDNAIKELEYVGQDLRKKLDSMLGRLGYTEGMYDAFEDGRSKKG